jgi:hypothetical protein
MRRIGGQDQRGLVLSKDELLQSRCTYVTGVEWGSAFQIKTGDTCLRLGRLDLAF